MAAAAACCLLYQTPAWAAKSPLISGTEVPGEAEGPALPDSTAAWENTETAAPISEEALNDNRIEYEELEALIRRGNSIAVNMENSFQDNLNNIQSAYDSLLSARRDMLNKADELEDENGDPAQIGSYEYNAYIISMTAKGMKKGLNTMNSATTEAAKNRGIWALVKGTQQLMGVCRELDAQVELLQKTVDVCQAARDKTASMKNTGLATEDDLLLAEKSLLSAQINLQTLQDNAAKLKRQLAIMLGKDASNMELGDLPPVTKEELSALNLEEDRAKAVIANSDVKSLRRSSAAGDANRKLRRQQLEEAESSANITADQQYQEIAALSLDRDAAVVAFAAAENDYGAAQRRYNLGMIDKQTYLSGVAQYYQVKLQKESAETELRIAVDAYQWMLKGVS